ncbi:hypothetical protein HFO73_32430 [Rhizobium laguerreae]|uniref:hypothetical protein n=1 Tax=Rhizobium laguerreae TaxID=1076926 RepID=UPI001C90EAF1|nr:hypothetical protein [Rhizobium laguerreae]MBY3081871.1 hypothetical protein [Rhizobium laguerreae]MBY3294451.1 hypothetical protein [Rhizobium laguerreae]MBY3327323.1 hypothetical protein [Rhizobium laguerreae]
MTEAKKLSSLKLLAKRYARANRITLRQALDLVAGKLGFANWAKLVSASKNDWLPDPEQLARVEAFVAHALPAADFQNGDPEAMTRRFAFLEQAEHGMIGDHAYRLQAAFHDVIMAGDKWSITVPENPGASPIVQTSTENDGKSPVFDPEFLQKALSLVSDRAVQVRAEISADWPRRSTKPDIDGVVRHPLWGRDSGAWFCLHCDGKITGTQIAQNLWHCPGCGASPLDIFDTAFWCEDEGKSLAPVKTDGAVDGDKLAFRVVDDRPKLELNEEKITLLIRSALLDDATNISEKLGALQAQISVDDKNDVWISLEDDLWPHDKEPVQALIVAAQLGIEVELESMWSSIPFAWPGLGELTSSTSEYTQMMLDAYAQYDGSPDKQP